VRGVQVYSALGGEPVVAEQAVADGDPGPQVPPGCPRRSRTPIRTAVRASSSTRRTLEQAPRHYGVTGLDPSPALEQAVFGVFLARERYDIGVQAVRVLLTVWIAEPAPVAEGRGLIDRLVQPQRVLCITRLLRKAQGLARPRGCNLSSTVGSTPNSI
jgi:hypothetical protein